MKLIDLTCPRCNAPLQADFETNKCTCQYCRSEILIDDEIRKTVDFSTPARLPEVRPQQQDISIAQAREILQKQAQTNQNTQDVALLLSIVDMIPFFSMFFLLQLVCIILCIHLLRERKTYEFSVLKFVATCILTAADIAIGIWMWTM